VGKDVISPGDRLVMVVGSFGSGKTELSVNLALQLAEEGRRVELADLDLVNPYFRSREARSLLEERGIRVVVPPGAQAWADLPIVLPEIRGMRHPPEGVVTILDVGGDDVGARALASFRPDLRDGQYELWQVLNPNRPFTATAEGCLAMKAEIEGASRLSVTGFLVNAHLMEDTTVETVLAGVRVAQEVAAATGLPIRAVAALRPLARAPELHALGLPLLELSRRMVPPWLAGAGTARLPNAPGRRGTTHGNDRD